MRIAEHPVRTVPRVRDRDLGWVRIIPGGARGHEIVLVTAKEMRRGLSHEGRVRAWKMRRIVSRDVRVIRGEIRADRLRVNALKIIVGLAVFRDDQVEIAGAHIEGPEAFADDRIRAGEAVRRQNGLGLCSVLVHDLEPAHEFAGVFVEDNVRPVHVRRRVDAARGILGIRRNDESQILPVVKVRRAVAAHAPVPDALGGIREFLVLSVPIIGAVQERQRAAVGLYPLALGVEPHLPGPYAVISFRVFHRGIPPFYKNRRRKALIFRAR